MHITLLKAFGFLKIKYNGSNLNFVLYYLPITLSIFVAIFLFMLDSNSSQNINIFTQKSFDSISTFVQVLPGFYIASLAAIASYNNPNIDNAMTGNPPYLEEKLAGGSRKSKLSRRRFLTLMFGYLAAVSMLSTVFLFFTRLSYDSSIIPVNHIVYGIFIILYVLYSFSSFSRWF